MIRCCSRCNTFRSKWITKPFWMKNVRRVGRWCMTRATCTLERRWRSTRRAISVDRITRRCHSFEDHRTFCGCICNVKWPIYGTRRRSGFRISTIWNNAPVLFIEALKSTIVIRSGDLFVKSIQRYVCPHKQFAFVWSSNWTLFYSHRSPSIRSHGKPTLPQWLWSVSSF